MSVFNSNKVDHINQTCFFGTPVNIARYETVKYPQIEKLTEKQLSFFWRPEEVELSRDGKDFRSLNTHEQHIFTSNLKRQILLDSVQGRAPSLAFLPICSLPELETWIQTWTFSETIHSRSYTHIIRNIYSDPSKVFDDMLDIQEIVDCATDISKYYDMLITWNRSASMEQLKEIDSAGTLYEHKKALWLCLNAVNALEGIRFYVSFACSWAFAEVKKMEGNAKIIKLIARDENVHLAFTQQILKILPKEDPDFAKIKIECAPEVEQIFADVINQEKTWATYLMKDGSIVGLNEKLLYDYTDWIAHKRMISAGVASTIKPGSNPLPWTQSWISGADVQVAPQQVQVSSYLTGGILKDIDEATFKRFIL